MALIHTAIELAKKLGPVIPLRGKLPLWDGWPARATMAPDSYSEPEWRYASGIGLVTGPRSRLFVLDVDGSRGRSTLAALEVKHGPLPNTLRSDTGGGGLQYFFQIPHFELRNSVGKVGLGIDIRAGGGFVVLPPSLHPIGTRYRWSEWHSPWEVQPCSAPAWLLEILEPKPVVREQLAPLPQVELRDVLRRASAYLTKIPGAVSGAAGHDQTWLAALYVVRGFALGEELGYELLAAEYNHRCDPPWTERELRHKVEDATRNALVPWGFLLRRTFSSLESTG